MGGRGLAGPVDQPGQGSGGTSGPGPLSGTSVVVTRARAQASGLVQRLSALGARVVELPVIVIEAPDDDGAALAAAVERAVDGAYEWIVVTSGNAVERTVDALDGRSVPSSTRWAVVGSSTAKALLARGIEPDLVPDEAVSDALVARFPPASVDGDPPGGGGGRGAVLFVRAESVREVVAPGLAAKGWRVDEAVAYRTAAGTVDADAIAAARGADAVAFTSSSTVERTVELLGTSGVPPLVATIGPVTSATARAAGLEVAVEAVDHTLDGLVAAVVAAVSGRGSEDGSGAGAPASSA